jgi:uncharacterized protein (DUF1800 family)
MSRKALLAGLAAAALALGANAFRTKLPAARKIDHALNRLTFGPRPGDADRVRGLGLQKWIDLQLHPERIPENPDLEARLAPLDTLAMTAAEMARKYPRRISAQGATKDVPLQGRPRSEAVRRLAAASTVERRAMLAQIAPPQVIVHDLIEAKLLRAAYSNRQLAEVLADFWFNHFNVYLNKGADRYLVTSYERDAIRPHVFGKFSDLLRATAQHPAMLFYLDNWQSVDPQAVERLAARRRPGSNFLRRFRGLNENYARELLELHTLGVDGGYTQQDVVEVARCFTGWTIRDPRQGGGFHFEDRLHDKGEKTVLGVKIPAGRGQEDGLQVLDIVSRHPSTARFISRKLAQRFVADQPPDSLIQKMAKSFTKTGGDLREVMKTMLDSPEFWSEGAWRAKMKSPLEMVASAVRRLDADVDSAFLLGQAIERLGQPLYRKAEPTGYSDLAEEWTTTSGLLQRLNFAEALASNRIRGVRIGKAPGLDADAALLLGSPEFQRR